ncbi:PREDICTED: uncharacterized protein LOC108663792 [Theobroma cacao]|uniref:Uncharacterized protein LOC108663792 n=1 Tax=Theobroma cacao TaxID=3641 RepID=A0AB32X133_THECC|nr:PREDICTED: uncharacterized protein LOC108663792 [Theobroma cacao]
MEQNEVIDGIHAPRQLLNRFIFHKHSMRFYEVTKQLEENQYCEACHMVISGPCYKCETCLYYLHEKCGTLPFEMQYPFHSSHRLSLYTSYAHSIICDECRDICFGFFYSCNECDFKLDVKCAALTAHKTGVSQLKEMEKVAELHHFTHQHKLVLGNFIDPILEIDCHVCNVPIFGLAYVCPKPSCIYGAHKSCLELPQKIQVPFHLEHMLNFFRFDKRLRCYACRWFIKGSYKYSCEQCGLNLHPTCANSLRRPLKCESHVHNLYYFGTNYQPKAWFPVCSVCGELCKAFYRCLECAINFHLDCVPIPRIVHSKYHVHHLTMKDSFLEDDSGEYYCDICEEERYPNDHVYCCEECNGLFAAHIECVVVKLVEDYTVVIDEFSSLELDFEKNSAQDLIRNNSESTDQGKEEDSTVSESEKSSRSSEEEDSSASELEE